MFQHIVFDLLELVFLALCDSQVSVWAAEAISFNSTLTAQGVPAPLLHLSVLCTYNSRQIQLNSPHWNCSSLARANCLSLLPLFCHNTTCSVQ